MANIYHAPYKVTQPYAYTGFPAEPPATVNGVYYQHWHRGVDMVGPSNTCPIYAAVPGVVFSCGTDTDGAVYVIELADTGHYLCYWHLSKITCTKGQRIDNNTQIGNQGNSGNSTNFHLHLEIHQPGVWQGLLKMTPIDPTPFLADQGAANDMDTHQIARDLYQTFTGQVPGDDIINQKADYMTATGNIQQVAKDLLAAGIETNPIPNRWALAIYDGARGGTNPDQFATDRLIGGTNFRQVMTGDIPTYVQRAKDADSLDAKLAAATVDAFKQAYLTRAGDYPTKDQVADWQHSQADIPAWVNAHAPSKNEAELQRQVDQLTQSIGTLQTTTQQALNDKDTTIGQLQAKIDGKPYVEPVEETPAEDGGIVFSPDPKPVKKQGSFLSWVIDIIKALGGSK